MAQTSPKLRPNVDTGVICKGCRGVHFFSGMSEGLVPYKYKSGKYSIRCQVDGGWFDYKLSDDEIVYRETPPTSSHESHESILTRIIEIENRIAKLEGKTAELPEKNGIKQLKEEWKDTITGFLSDSQQKSDQKEPRQYG